MSERPSPFAWQGKPSKLGRDHAFNGVDKAKADRKTALPKKDIYVLRKARPITTYGRAVLDKTAKQFETPL